MDKQLLHRWLSERVSQESLSWLEQKQEKIAQGAPERVFFTAFSAVPRYIGKQALDLSVEDLEAAQEVRPGWFAGHWTVDQAGRTLLVLSLPCDRVATPPEYRAETYVQTLNKVFTTADEGELVALYQSLPLLPYPEKHKAQAAEGVRSNMTTVFNAVALRNPYPAEYFDDIAWNQMVLKAVFIGSPLYLIQGLDERANPQLAQMLVDYAHERWSAKRPVTPELWRVVGGFVDDAIASDLQKVLSDSDIAQQQAAALACSQSSSPQTQALLASRPDLQSLIQNGNLTWDSFSQHHLSSQNLSSQNK
ncbi:EboA family metabolite traffic protein [Coleofasciculus sp. G2-EDA-02]|uniref:EboA family metabolite traffic protein n=1 Tax=Coleofasciculus sp. G2-EDA-02 TaxID=3069529 RepID=UPI0032F21EC9